MNRNVAIPNLVVYFSSRHALICQSAKVEQLPPGSEAGLAICSTTSTDVAWFSRRFFFLPFPSQKSCFGDLARRHLAGNIVPCFGKSLLMNTGTPVGSGKGEPHVRQNVVLW